MTCAPFDLKDYFFGELNAEQRGAVEQHVDACAACREELAALSATRSAVLCMREEEPPRRIAFVSDKVFEPRWWQKLLASGPQLGFASAAMLAVAIVFHAVRMRPAPVAGARAGRAGGSRRSIEAEIAKRVQAAVEKAVARERGAAGGAAAADRERAAGGRAIAAYEMDLKTIAALSGASWTSATLNVRQAMHTSRAGAIQ